jgi:hypothetical protein
MRNRGIASVAATAAAAILTLTPMAQADSGGATIRSIPESEELQVEAEVHHQCYGAEPCDWFAEASAETAGYGCPASWDGSHSIWVSEVREVAIPVAGSFAFLPYGLGRDVEVCLYVHAEGSSELAGASHPFDRATGREVLPQPKPPPRPLPQGFHRHCGEVSAKGRDYEVIARRGTETCALAKRTMRRYLTSRPGTHAYADGWVCRAATDSGLCTRGGLPAREWIEAVS